MDRVFVVGGGMGRHMTNLHITYALANLSHRYIDEEYLVDRRKGSKGPVNPNNHTNVNKGAYGGKNKSPMVKRNKRKAKQAARNVRGKK